MMHITISVTIILIFYSFVFFLIIICSMAMVIRTSTVIYSSDC